MKLHVALNGDHWFPEQVLMTTGSVHDVNKMSELSQEKGTIYVYDRGYSDYKRLYDINISGSFFVTRMKDNCCYEMVNSISFSEVEAVRQDAVVRLTSEQSRQRYPDEFRRVAYYDAETGRDYAFMTNDFISTAQEIADIYKARWQVELFFKWIKQNLKIKTFWGTSRNAVYTQLWVALIVFMLLWIAKHIENLAASPQRILQLLKTALLEKRSIIDLFREPEPLELPDQGQFLLGGLAFVGGSK
jgi:IS4 transposase